MWAWVLRDWIHISKWRMARPYIKIELEARLAEIPETAILNRQPGL